VNRTELKQVYTQLLDHFGPQQWWPADTPFEVLVGAILTQNTAWNNVEKAIANLSQAGLLESQALAEVETDKLEGLIRPSGYYRQKAARLLSITRLLCAQYDSDVVQLCNGTLEEARKRLLSLHGIGEETADAILLYAAERPSFVVDAYTRRLFSRLGILSGTEGYAQIRSLFMEELPHEVKLFNEYHALIVIHCKEFCRKQNPHCMSCPLNTSCPSVNTI